LLTAAGKELLAVVSGAECGCAPEWYLQEFANSLINTDKKKEEVAISIV